MRIVVIGSGAREHAIAVRLQQEGNAVRVIPGNAGMARNRIPCERVDFGDGQAAHVFIRAFSPALAVIGPEQPLVDGLADALREFGVSVCGPSAAAAQLEGSKAFAEKFMARYAIPRPRTMICSDEAEVRRALEADPRLLVVKVDGLAAGKGVKVCQTPKEAIDAALELRRTFNVAGRRIILQHRLQGPELSVFVACDGARGEIIGWAQDYKRRFEGDAGPNTGGMGAVSTPEQMPDELRERIMESIVAPTLKGMRNEGRPFKGILFFGLMLTDKGPKVLEYNVRFGDPECAVVLSRLEGELGQWLYGAAMGRLPTTQPIISASSSVGVVLCGKDYPEKSLRPSLIEGFEAAAQIPGAQVFCAGISQASGGEKLMAMGGRLVLVTGTAITTPLARGIAYGAIKKIYCLGSDYRPDIALDVE